MSFRNTGFNYNRPRPSATISHERRRVNFEALITLAAVIISSAFSYFSLQETRRQSKVATDQLKLSTAQFKEAQRQFYTERLDKVKDDRERSLQYTRDTLRISKRDKFQIESFKKQLQVYNQQLSVIKKQANFAQQQFEAQAKINRQQIIKDRPIFMIDKVTYDSTINAAEFSIKNIGVTPSVVTRITMFSINKRHLQTFGNNDTYSNTVLNGSTFS